MTLINRAQVLEALSDLVARKGPEFVYDYHRPNENTGPACRYEDGGCPSCGIGDILYTTFGVPLVTLVAMDNYGSIEALHTLATLADAGFRFTPGAVVAMKAFQRVQDRRQPYDVALRCAQESSVDLPEFYDVPLDAEVDALPLSKAFWGNPPW